MDARRWSRFGLAFGVLLALPALLGASRKTQNFEVEAATSEAANAVAERAERCRKELALRWLGRELPPWNARCPIRVRLTDGEAGGVTSFGFGKNRVNDRVMTLEGRLDRILASALPHEVTHTIFADHLGGPMPRWADEGASLLSEDDREKQRQDRIAANLIAGRKEIELARLFKIEEYPQDLLGFYGQGYSVSRFLIEVGGRRRFLNFVRDGSRKGWDAAARSHYGLADCRELDRAWHSWHSVNRARPRPDSNQLAARPAPARSTASR